MSSDTDSSSDSSTTSVSSESSTEYKKKHKLSKKRKYKVEKKDKKRRKKTKTHKEKKRSRKESKSKLNPSDQRSEAVEADEDCFGPTLPPHLQKKSESTVTSSAAPIIGPVLPMFENTQLKKGNESDDDIDIGPLPSNAEKLSDAQIEREKRALELKIAVLEGRSLQTNTNDDKAREEWMLELPEVGLKGGLAALNNMKRTFHTGKDKPDFSDRSDWTKTPQSESKDQSVVMKPKVNSAEDLKSQAQFLYERARDAEQEQLAKKHKKKHKRDESLVELHQKKLRKAEKQKEKELAASGSKPERRPFSRDVDLKLNKIDKNQTKQIVDKAKILNTKFSSGKAKYL